MGYRSPASRFYYQCLGGEQDYRYLNRHKIFGFGDDAEQNNHSDRTGTRMADAEAA
jgi:hypothetical protein